MIRLLTRSPVLMTIFPFSKNTGQYDKPANAVIKPLDDKLGWDRIKRIFSLEYVSYYTYLVIKSLFASIAYINIHFYTMDRYYNFIFQ